MVKNRLGVVKKKSGGVTWRLKSNLFIFSPLLVVQHECIPQAILGMDVLCQAKSGMGKTAVFVLATLQQLEPVTGQVYLGRVLWRTFWLEIFERGVLS